MNVVTRDDVRASGLDHWEAIEWRKVNKSARRLQARIVKAEREGRHGKVQSLSRILTRSFGGRALAVKRVTENQGKRTAGVDNVLWSTPAQKRAAIDALQRKGYHALPLRRVYIPKANGKRRPLGIPTMKDRAMQALHLLALAPIAECRADTVSYGFRPKRSTADAVAQCQIALARNSGASWILEGDIKGCFDHISHEWLEKHIPMDKRILHQWLNAGYMEAGTLHDTSAGTPQGGIISPVLANMTLDGLQLALNRRFKRFGHNRGKPVWRGLPTNDPKVNLVRYADDFIITATTQEVLRDEVLPLVRDFLSERGLTLSEEKTRITHIEEGFDFLGKTMRKFDGKFRAYPAKKSVQTFLQNVRGIIRLNRAARPVTLIRQLNPVIRGWAEYHRVHASRNDYRKVSGAIFTALWHWAKRRHPKKGVRWIREKYFTTCGRNRWAFFGELREGGILRLHQIGREKVGFYVKINNEVNPFDPAWQEYLANRVRQGTGRTPRHEAPHSGRAGTQTDE